MEVKQLKDHLSDLHIIPVVLVGSFSWCSYLQQFQFCRCQKRFEYCIILHPVENRFGEEEQRRDLRGIQRTVDQRSIQCRQTF